MKLGFIGLGNMGTPMARNLLRAGHELSVYNRTRAKAEPLAGEAVRGCEAAITMLADDDSVQELIADEKYQPAGFRLRLGLKDVNLALAAGEQAVPMPLAMVTATMTGPPSLM